jgi:hypothetical protein
MGAVAGRRNPEARVAAAILPGPVLGLPVLRAMFRPGGPMLVRVVALRLLDGPIGLRLAWLCFLFLILLGPGLLLSLLILLLFLLNLGLLLPLLILLLFLLDLGLLLLLSLSLLTPALLLLLPLF